MNGNWESIWAKIFAMFIVMGAGWVARRRNWFSDHAASASGRFVMDVAFPALTFRQMLATVNGATLKGSIPLFLISIGVLAFAHAGGYFMARALRAPAKPTQTFLSGTPNWLFLPLALVPAVAGDAGVRVVLLFNIPAQVFIWTVCVWVLRGGFRGAHSFHHLLANPGLIATLLGIILAVRAPHLAASSAWGWSATLSALDMLGQLTVPLSLVVTGAQLGGIRLAGAWNRALGGVLAARLLILPLLTTFLLRWVPLDSNTRIVVALIASMPVAVSCALFVERFGGDRDLTARAVAVSTLLSLLTLPLQLQFILFWSGANGS